MVFFEYLDGAPKLEDINGETEDPEKCGDLREYFEYDRDYPDDDRICEEIRDLQVSDLSLYISYSTFLFTIQHICHHSLDLLLNSA